MVLPPGALDADWDWGFVAFIAFPALLCQASSCALRRDLRHTVRVLVPALPRASYPKQLRLVEGTPHKLEPDRKTGARHPRGETERGRPGQRSRDGEDVVQVHRQRIVDLLTQHEGRGGRGREQDRVGVRK